MTSGNRTHDSGGDHFQITDARERVWEEWYGDMSVARYCYVHGKPGDEGTVVRTEDVGKGIHLDYDAEGKLLGIEFLADIPDVWAAKGGINPLPTVAKPKAEDSI